MIKTKGKIQNIAYTLEDLKQHIGETITIHGAIHKIRLMSTFAFLLLRTRKDLIQCILTLTPENKILLKEEACVSILGNITEDTRSIMGFEVHIMDIQFLSTPANELPVVINNKHITLSMDTLLDYRPITLRNIQERAIFKLQEGIVAGARFFLSNHHFTEIHTPKIISAGAEGGANAFQLNYFNQIAYLAQSPQTYKQMMVGVYERVFEIAPVYRAEKHDTARHLNEYISIDFEMGYIESFYDIIETETAMLSFIIDYLSTEYLHEIELLDVALPKITEIPILTFHEAKELIQREFNRTIKDYEDFEPEEERLLCEYLHQSTGSEFVFVTHYPTSKRPFYTMDDPVNSEVTLSFDLLFRGIEITTGGQRIHDYHSQLEKLSRKGMNHKNFESYLMAHQYGLPPHGGLGFGLERFTSRLLNQNNIRYATLFPRDTQRLIP